MPEYEVQDIFFSSDFIHYYNFKEQLQMKNGFTLVDLRRQKKIWDFLVTPVWEETETGNSVKASVNQKLFHLTNPLQHHCTENSLGFFVVIVALMTAYTNKVSSSFLSLHIAFNEDPTKPLFQVSFFSGLITAFAMTLSDI